ncbi:MULTISPECIES: uracil-xanthine permease family protein [Clostridium]|uniref:Uracil permease n=1 Tax=Clostridium botulinum (strain Eklund 17B / Type B) TaxID=935198 RepID=B2TPH7_CLOBB|nr:MULTISPECIES: uracil-xanthine permease family protein [Clostridium]ACD24132.1 uracil permease [Clostridium botulinum B str. Eklund 17B (NRP)]MBN1053084.1 uracil-xanthine permease [Clostridium botulinum]MBY6975318.1 uracil-xanthine permease [Clostridium botulinum]MBY7000867.1 uracil-xanthine permease [Clostridium botulinum]MCR1273633.1 uracil-xanthine permease family protein [Clostridium botulinum]
MSEIISNTKEQFGEISLRKTGKKIVLALQHLIAMFGSTVLVPILTGLDISVALFCAGIGTLIFHICTKMKVPVFLGSSFAFIPVICAVKVSYGDLRYAQGGIMIAGLIYVLMSFIIKKIGTEKIKVVLPAQVVGPMIMVIGLNLIPTAFNMAKENIIIAVITLGVTLGIKYFSKGFISQIAILCGVACGYLISYFTGYVDTQAIAEAGFITIPNFTLPKFDLGAIVIIAPVVLATFMEHIGDITTNGQVVGENFIEEPGLNRTLLGDGLATMTAAFFGGPANTTYGENTGVLAMTKNYDPSILRLAAIFAILLSFVGKFGTAISTIPQAVMGGISLMLFTMIALVGFKTLKYEKVKMNWKNAIIVVTILVIGFLGTFIEKKFGILVGIRINDAVSISGLSFAAIVGVLLNLVLNKIKLKR